MILNDVKVIGNLVNDPEVRFTPKGTPVANLSLGINETYTVDDEKRQITTFVGSWDNLMAEGALLGPRA
jgi:single-strand DNA-binding protein